MKDDLRHAFAFQAEACASLGSPFMARLLTLLPAIWDGDSALDARTRRFAGDIGPSGHSLPLRLAGGLHALVLSGQSPDLAAVYPPKAAPDAALAETLKAALQTHQRFLVDWIESPPQTNEVRRSAALIAGAHVAARVFDRPVILSELGASGGLNLTWDSYALEGPGWRLGPADARVVLRPEWTGAPPPEAAITIAERRGVDLRPVDGHSDEGRLRLLSYLWADQPDRLALTQAALDAPRPMVDAGDAIDWLEQRLADAPKGHLHLIQHSIAWQYFPPEGQARGAALIADAGSRATPDTPLAHLSMEADDSGERGAAVVLKLWPGAMVLPLGRVDFHGRWVDWQA